MTGDTVTVFDTARAEAIAVMAAVRYVPGGARAMNAAILDALLAARSSTTCETCGGTGAAHLGTCPDCDGSGTVPGGPLLLDLVAEPYGYATEEDEWMAFPGQSKPVTWWIATDKPFGNPRYTVPVFVAREST